MPLQVLPGGEAPLGSSQLHISSMPPGVCWDEPGNAQGVDPGSGARPSVRHIHDLPASSAGSPPSPTHVPCGTWDVGDVEWGGSTILVGRADLDPPEDRVPCNGWGWADDQSARLGMVVDHGPGRAGADRPGDMLGTVKRRLTSISIGTVPVLRGVAKRGAVRELSDQSKCRMAASLADLLAPYQYMATLTVGREWSRDGRDFKHALDRFLIWFMRRQRALSDEPDVQSVFWFLEFQARGAPHVHFFYTERVPWKESATKWAECIDPMGESPEMWRTSTKFERLRGGRAAIGAYAAKYARKSQQKQVPPDYEKVGRFWGVRGYKAHGTIHITGSGVARGKALVERFEGICQRFVALGLLRRVPWLEGSGATWYTVGDDDLYSCGVGQVIDAEIRRWLDG